MQHQLVTLHFYSLGLSLGHFYVFFRVLAELRPICFSIQHAAQMLVEEDEKENFLYSLRLVLPVPISLFPLLIVLQELKSQVVFGI